MLDASPRKKQPPTRVSIPTDVFTTLCLELQRMSDVLLLAAKRLIVEHHDEGPLAAAIFDANLHLGNLMEIAKALLEEPEREGDLNG